MINQNDSKEGEVTVLDLTKRIDEKDKQLKTLDAEIARLVDRLKTASYAWNCIRISQCWTDDSYARRMTLDQKNTSSVRSTWAKIVQLNTALNEWKIEAKNWPPCMFRKTNKEAFPGVGYCSEEQELVDEDHCYNCITSGLTSHDK